MLCDSEWDQLLNLGAHSSSVVSWYSHTFHGAGIWYKSLMAIHNGDIAAFNSPFQTVDWLDVIIFCDQTMGILFKGERVEADDGYRSEPGLTNFPGESWGSGGEREREREIPALLLSNNNRRGRRDFVLDTNAWIVCINMVSICICFYFMHVLYSPSWKSTMVSTFGS